MLESSNQKIVVICGPTGIGKTELSLSLAEAFHGSIVSADSMQIYRYMNIGTAKSAAGELRRVPHYMIDIVDPDEPFDAAKFYQEGRQAIAQIYDRHQVPFIVGGTGFYIKALLHGLFEAKSVDPVIINRLGNEADSDGTQALYERLCVCDPEAASRIHVNDAYRVIRALAVFEMSGKPMSEYQQRHGFKESPFDVLKICLFIDREVLYDRINRRVDQMIEDGLLAEVKSLLQKGYSGDLKSMQSIGYRHMVNYINEKNTWDETVYTLKRDTRRFAKRQLTWFRKDTEMIWKAPADADGVMAEVRGFLEGS
ncbi:MAG: tRNA (adenosine(37)-N6)-dimethylallyltransferase MiaA [Desulfobacteraceae bacterium]|nr:tRNA (adenosine(37)-N6)-dimethylallyltransferase MiaA [Desulfobacteraceae bacterium]